ncbi:MAG: carbon-phosphorus lyase complex subunit PhnI [Deltaproteobacteria bacterium]|jgi:alpha-D-ribose 1-methylphosphonate 5-triphosphate synthase subunit PhnI|nr:carbon-phosphorus lyase complex subunit PhnI [Deltaproteobacteria bacterium]
MYVAVKGGARAIAEAHKLLEEKKRGDMSVPLITLEQIKEQMHLAVSRVMAEGSLYAPDLAALAIQKAWGDLVEAIFLLRAARTSYQSFGYSEPVDTASMRVTRRISATWKDLPGGQILGATFDYTHRLLEDSQDSDEQSQETSLAPSLEARAATFGLPKEKDSFSKVFKAARILEEEGILEVERDTQSQPCDLTMEPLSFPAGRDLRLQNLARGDEGFVLALAYSTQRGFGSTHPFVTELRVGYAKVEFTPPELGFPICIGEIELTECETVNHFVGQENPRFTRGYGLCFGNNERKAISMAMVERALRSELGELKKGPAQDEEFVLAHSDNVEAAGFVSHVKLPHYVDFQSELSLLRDIRKKERDLKLAAPDIEEKNDKPSAPFAEKG